MLKSVKLFIHKKLQMRKNNFQQDTSEKLAKIIVNILNLKLSNFLLQWNFDEFFETLVASNFPVCNCLVRLFSQAGLIYLILNQNPPQKVETISRFLSHELCEWSCH